MRKASEPLERGNVRVESDELGIRVTVAKAWELAGRRFGDMRTWGLKLDIEETSERGMSAPRNYEFGFFGTWDAGTDNADQGGPSAARAWRIVIDTLGSGTGTGIQDRELAEKLDRSTGRHYADTLAGGSTSEDALRRAVTRIGPPRE